MQRIVAREDFVKCEKWENGKHPTTLHGYVRKKVDNTQHQCNSEASGERQDAELAACASLNTVMDVISMCSSSKVKTWRLERDFENLCTFGQLYPVYPHFREIAGKIWHKRKENINNHKNT